MAYDSKICCAITGPRSIIIFIKGYIQYPVQVMVSRPREPPPQPLAERYVSLSTHTAPIKQTPLPFLPANGQITPDCFSQSVR